MPDLLQPIFNLLMLGLIIPLGSTAVVGFVVSVVQSVTQIQEQTLGYAIKLITVSIVLGIVYRSWQDAFSNLTANIFELIVVIGRAA